MSFDLKKELLQQEYRLERKKKLNTAVQRKINSCFVRVQVSLPTDPVKVFADWSITNPYKFYYTDEYFNPIKITNDYI